MDDEKPVRLGTALYYPDAGCLRSAHGTVVELTVRENELLEILMSYRVTVPYAVLCHRLELTQPTVMALASMLRKKLGEGSVRNHSKHGFRLSPLRVLRDV